MTKGEKTIYVILGIVCAGAVVLFVLISQGFISWKGNPRIHSTVPTSVPDSNVQDQQQVVESKKNLLFVAQVAKGGEFRPLTFSIFDPIKASVVAKRTIYPENNIGLRRYNNDFIYTKFIPLTQDVYYVTDGNKVPITCPPNAYECYGDPVCPPQGECVENILWKINMKNSAPPEKVYSNTVTSTIYNPLISISEIGDFAGPSAREGVPSYKYTMQSSAPNLPKGVGDVEGKGVFYIVTLTSGSASNPDGVHGIRYRNFGTGEDTDIITGPSKIWSVNKDYILASSEIGGKNDIYLVDLTTMQRISIPSTLTENVQGYDLLRLF